MNSLNSVWMRGSVAVAALLATPLIAQDASESPIPESSAAVAANNEDPGSAQPLNMPRDARLFTATTTEPAQPVSRGATAIVNGDIVTGTDIAQRVALVQAASGNKISGPELERLRAQVLSNLIDELLQVQEASAAEIQITDQEVDQTYIRVSQQNFGTNPDQLDAYLKQIGSSAQSLKQQIRGELAWSRLLRRNIAPFINVSEEEVAERLARLEADKGTEEYRLGEIFLAATSENKPEVRQRAQQIAQQLQQGASFVAYARQYSEASTAAVGGDLGFVRLSQLPPELAEVAQTMESGQLVGPVELRGGFSLLYLIDKRQVLVADPRDTLLSLKQISIELPKDMSQEAAVARAGKFAEDVKTLGGCGGADANAPGIGAQVVSNDNVKVRDLPAALHETLLTLPQGGLTQPFGSAEEGVRVLMVCGRTSPAAGSGPSAEELMARIEDERINKRAQIYLRDLRRDAVIEYR